jgi:hypothetical protein
MVKIYGGILLCLVSFLSAMDNGNFEKNNSTGFSVDWWNSLDRENAAILAKKLRELDKEYDKNCSQWLKSTVAYKESKERINNYIKGIENSEISLQNSLDIYDRMLLKYNEK